MLGENISELLWQQRRTQAWLARQCGVTKSHINKIIKGNVNPSLKLLTKISEVLSVSIGDMTDSDLRQPCQK